MVNIWKDWNLRQFKICKEGVPGSSTALKFLFRRYHMNLNKTWMIMVIIHTNNLAQKLLYLSFHFQNAVDCQAFLLSFTWRRGFRILDIVFWNNSYGSVYFWTHPGSSPLTWYWYCPHKPRSPSLLPKHWAQISFDIWLTFQNICLPLLLPFLFLPPYSPSLLETNWYKGGVGGLEIASPYSSGLRLDRRVSVPEICED